MKRRRRSAYAKGRSRSFWAHPLFEVLTQRAGPVDDSPMYPVDVSELEAESTPDTREADRVLHWRCEEFARLGFGLRTRLVLARSEADLALARKLVAAGCQLATAEQILL